MLKCSCGGNIYSYKTLDAVVSGVQIVMRYKKCSRCGQTYQSIERLTMKGDAKIEEVSEEKK